MLSSIPNIYLQALIEQAQNPPGKDHILKAFYACVVQDLKKYNSLLLPIISQVLNSRNITSQHFVNLLFRSVQYIELFVTKNPDYPFGYEEIKKWDQEIFNIVQSHSNELEYLLNTKSTTTTIYQRYAGLYFILSELHKKDWKVVDFGCGGNYGLPGIIIDEKFLPILDSSEQNIINKALKKKVTILEGLAIDKETPYSLPVRKWRLACSFYPSELASRSSIESFEKKIEKVSNVKFIMSDVTKKIDDASILKNYDIVNISTVLYQLEESEQNKVMDNAKSLLCKSGAIVIQDFAIKDAYSPQKLTYVKDWFKSKFCYRTFYASEETSWEFLEILQWSDGRCRTVKKGEDFNRFESLKRVLT